MITDIKAKASQVSPVVTGDGDLDYLKMTKLGAMFTANWKTQLLLAGKVWQARVGTVAAGADPTKVLGGGSGTTIDLNQPELVIGVDVGYYLIPIEVRACIQENMNADGDIAEIVLVADRSAAPVATNASGTIHSPVNMLDGGGAFPGRCWVQSIGDITGPVTDQILDYVTFQMTVTDTTSPVAPPLIRMDYCPEVPTILAGPCQVVLCWGGTSGASGLGIVTVACVPTSWFPVS